MANKGINTRELVVDMLLTVSAGKEYSHVLIRNVLDKYDYLEGREKAFIKQVTEGCLERRLELDYYLDAFSKIPVSKMKPFIRELLRMSAYQILFLSRVPDRAVIDEAVKLTRKRGFSGLTGFVNGVLRSVSREGKAYPLPDEKEQPVRAFSIRYSMPEWIVEYFFEEYGTEKTGKILQGLLEVRPVTIRFRQDLSKKEREALLKQMEAAGVSVRQHPYLPLAYELRGLESVTALPGFAEGKLTVQDVSSMLAVEAAGIKPGDRILDVCAAPGGKTAYAAMLAGEGGMVEARDLSAYKTVRIEETCKRLGLPNVTVRVWDALKADPAWRGQADVVLADVPCLGLGVMGRKRDIKYRVQKKDLESIVELQKKIVTAAAQYVKPQGTLLYSTCSMTREENIEMVSFMKEELGLMAESLEEVLPESFLRRLTDTSERESLSKGWIQLLPGIHETDGFFFARMKCEGNHRGFLNDCIG